MRISYCNCCNRMLVLEDNKIQFYCENCLRIMGKDSPEDTLDTLDKRPTWDEYFLKIAKDVSLRSTCLRRHVGAVIVRDKRILSTGYNGPPKGIPHCKECKREVLKIPSGKNHEICEAVHAEQNAIIQAAVHGVSINNSTLYCTCSPCIICTKMIINAGIKRIFSIEGYPDSSSLEMLEKAGISLLYTK